MQQTDLHDNLHGAALEHRVGERLRAQSLTIATAESSTGGLLATRLTNVPGSSAYVIGGVVAYSNQVKQQMLGVRPRTLNEHGPVSEAVTRQMATGARIMFGADIVISITGLAGPGGGTREKPVGLTFIGLSTPTGTLVRRFEFHGARLENKMATTDAALNMLLAYFDELDAQQAAATTAHAGADVAGPDLPGVTPSPPTGDPPGST